MLEPNPCGNTKYNPYYPFRIGNILLNNMVIAVIYIQYILLYPDNLFDYYHIFICFYFYD